MSQLDEIASKHLGRASDGGLVKPYETPKERDPSLLVPVPRILNREKYDIDERNLPFVGFDVWHGYELSFLLGNGYPVSGVVKLQYPANSVNIVESKSLKLYFNSYNMMKFGGRDIKSAIAIVAELIKKDLNEVLGTHGYPPQVTIFVEQQAERYAFNYKFNSIEKIIGAKLGDLNFTAFNEDPKLLMFDPSIKTNGDGLVPGQCYVHSSSLRSNCRVTNQPDWGDVFIYLNPRASMPDFGSVLKYLVSMRAENHFHEEVCEMIYKRLLDFYKPLDLMVACLYTRRGGIDINPIRASSSQALEIAAPILNNTILTSKTLRQ